jgi:hypothetical protein
VLKSRKKKQENPAVAKRNNAGTIILFLPYRSAKTPNTGVRNTPGNVNIVINKPTCLGDILNALLIPGNAGVRLATPIKLTNVIEKIINRFLFFKRLFFIIKIPIALYAILFLC